MEITDDGSAPAPVGAGGGLPSAATPVKFGPRSFTPQEWLATFKAHAAGEDGYKSLREAGEHVGTSKQNFQHHFRAFNETGALPKHTFGPDPRLTKDVEGKLVDFILLAASSYMSLSPATVKEKAKQLAEACGMPRDSVGGEAWYASFKRRHPEISTRMPQEIEVARITATSSKNLKGFFDNLKSVYGLYSSASSGLAVDPDKIWNMDESAVMLRGSRAPVSKGRRRRATLPLLDPHLTLAYHHLCRSSARVDTPRTSAQRRRGTTSPSLRAAMQRADSSLPPSFLRASAPWRRTSVSGRMPPSS
jgi:hypothetical protein